MGKSQYPSKLDTSVEIPVARDMPASDVINSIRSAIFQIEKTLGINPQGSTGNTLASRINNALDANGNILPSALNKSGILTGPIANKDVLDSAGIEENKLKLNFPTELLQNEISIIDNQLSTLIDQLNILTTNFSSHISKNAINRHSGISISLEPKSSIPSSNATVNLTSANVVDFVDDIYNSHINYDAQNISNTNRSHTANQIFFNNTNTILDSNNVQDAIVEAYEAREGLIIDHQNLQHTNGILSLGDVNSFVNKEFSEIIYSNISVSFSENTGSADNSTVLVVNDAILSSKINVGNFVQLSDNQKIYQIKEISETSGNVDTITIFGLLNFSSVASSTINIGLSNKVDYNKSSLLVTAIEDPNLTSARSLLVLSPNMTRVISNNINPDAITATNKFITINDGYATHQVNVFDTSITRQTLDSIISRINTYSFENKGLFSAYRIDIEGKSSELVIAHNLENTIDLSQSLVIDRVDGAIDSLGLSQYEGIEAITPFNTKYYINGNKYFAIKEKLNLSGLVFFKGTNIIDRGLLNISFLELGIKSGDIICILDNVNYGSYLISAVSDTQLVVDLIQYPFGFVENSTEETKYIIYNNVINVNNITFDYVNAAFGSALLDIFINDEQDVHFSKILEYSNSLIGSVNLFEIVDVEGIINVSQSDLEIKLDPNNASGILLSLDSGDDVSIIGDNTYAWITSGSGNFRIKVLIKDVATIINKITIDALNIISNIYHILSQNYDYLFYISRIVYNNFSGRFSGGINGPRSFDKRTIGNVGQKQITNIAKKDLIYTPLSELRYNGVIYGLEILNQAIDSNGLYTFTVNRGVCYINGKRIEKDLINIETQISSLTNDKIFILIDEYGNILFDTTTGTNCTSPFGSTDFCMLGSVEYDGINVTYYDLRLFIDHLDLKLLNSISVSQQPGMGHFSDIRDAIKYAKRFANIFPLASIPSVHIKSGSYKINVDYTYNFDSSSYNISDPAIQEDFYNKIILEGLFIDFPILLEGEGANTVIELTSTLSFTNNVQTISMPLVISGPGLIAPSFGFDNLTNNSFITIKNIMFKNTRISLVDFVAETGANEQRYLVNLEDLIFDYYNFTPTFVDTTIGRRAVEILEVDNSVDNKGNINIQNCTFIKAGIYSTSAARTKNLNILNNIYFDDDGTTNFLLTDLLSLSSAATGSNINISNNRTSSSFSNALTNMVSGQTYNWSERFSRDVRIGNDLFVNNDANVTNDVIIGGNYTYDSAKSLVTMYYADDLLDSATWSSNSPWSGATNFTYGSDAITVSGVRVNFPYVILTAANTEGRFKIKPGKNGTLKQVTTFYNNGTAGNTITITLFRIDPTGGSSGGFPTPHIINIASASFTIPILGVAQRIQSATVNFNANITSNYHYLLQYQLSGGSNIDIYGLSTNIDVLTVESYLGVE